jgi:hypothetical protein
LLPGCTPGAGGGVAMQGGGGWRKEVQTLIDTWCTAGNDKKVWAYSLYQKTSLELKTGVTISLSLKIKHLCFGWQGQMSKLDFFENTLQNSIIFALYNTDVGIPRSDI